MGYKFIKHEQSQTSRIESLESQVAVLSESLKDDSSVREFVTHVTKDSFDYLAIGNGITLHSITDFWWENVGMAATTKDLDYYHIVTAELEKSIKKKNGQDGLNTAVYNYYV